jgi:uncharacterized protein YigA (DUF484 family)
MGRTVKMDKKEDIKRINEELAARFSKIEAKIQEDQTIAGLFETLFAGIEKEFTVPFVWLTLMDNEKAAPVIAAVKSSDILRTRICVISPELFGQLLPSGRKPVLVNKDLQPFYKLLPSSSKYFVKSLAIVPFSIGDHIIGSWNNGDAVGDRYTPDMETGLLAKLAVSVSHSLTVLVEANS